MGINAEFVQIVSNLRARNILCGESVVEIGAQDVCVANKVVSEVLSEHGLYGGNKVGEVQLNASQLYRILGFTSYSAIDASGNSDALMFDLNKDIQNDYNYLNEFDLVTNLGTSEHCFNQFAVFKNLHDLCRQDGVMIHALTAQGNVNHGFYNYHPRFIADLAVANGYEIISLDFTVDYKPLLISYSISEFKKWDSHDLLLYAVLRKRRSGSFCTPFDGMFSSSNKLEGYSAASEDPLKTEFSPYLKEGRWENTRGLDRQSSASATSRMRELFCRLLRARS